MQDYKDKLVSLLKATEIKLINKNNFYADKKPLKIIKKYLDYDTYYPLIRSTSYKYEIGTESVELILEKERDYIKNQLIDKAVKLSSQFQEFIEYKIKNQIGLSKVNNYHVFDENNEFHPFGITNLYQVVDEELLNKAVSRFQPLFGKIKPTFTPVIIYSSKEELVRINLSFGTTLKATLTVEEYDQILTMIKETKTSKDELVLENILKIISK